MDGKQSTFIGLDVSTGRRPFSYAALDGEMRLLALGAGGLQDALAFTAGQSRAQLAIGAPSGPNCALMQQPEVRRRFSSPPEEGRRSDLRLAEHELRLHRIMVARTPAEASQCPAWVQRGFELYRQLQQFGYRPYPQEDAGLQWLESHAEAAYWALLGLAPFPPRTLEGRLQRQLVLYDLRLPVTDPLRFFEEVTRHRLLHGVLPLKEIYTPAELNALVLAYTAWLAARRPQELLCFGAAPEGVLHLPRGKLPEVLQPPLF